MSQKLTVPHPRKKIDKTTLIVLSMVGVVLLIGCVVLGAAFDYAIGADGSIDGSKISPALHYVLSHPAVLLNVRRVFPKTVTKRFLLLRNCKRRRKAIRISKHALSFPTALQS